MHARLHDLGGLQCVDQGSEGGTSWWHWSASGAITLGKAAFRHNDRLGALWLCNAIGLVLFSPLAIMRLAAMCMP